MKDEFNIFNILILISIL